MKVKWRSFLLIINTQVNNVTPTFNFLCSHAHFELRAHNKILQFKGSELKFDMSLEIKYTFILDERSYKLSDRIKTA